MAKHLLRSLVLGTLCSALSALAQAPAVYSVTNVATNTTLLAPGTLANVWGTGFGNDAQQVSVQIGGKPAAVIGASSGQMNIQIPVELQPGKSVPVVVDLQGQKSEPFNIDLETYAPGIFTSGGIGWFVRANGSTVSANSPAIPQETLTLYGVGLGPTNPVVPTGTADASPSVVKPDLLVGGQAATVLYSGLVGGTLGWYQVSFTVPAGLAGSSQPVKLRIGGQESNTVSLPVAQFAVFPNGMVNAASSVPAGLPNGDIAQGSMFSIYGQNLGPSTSPALSWPLQCSGGLGGVKVQVTDSAGQTRCAIMLFVGPGQVNAILPSATATGQASLTVTYNGQTSAPQTFNVVQRSVGLLAWNQQGSGPGVIQQYHGPSWAFNNITTSALPGDVGVLWGTGLGPVTGDETQPPVQIDLGAGAEVWVGGQKVLPANVLYQGRSSSAGQDQINFVIPNNPGCYVPVFVKVGNVVSNTVSMSISANGGMCSDALSFSDLDPNYVKAHGLKQGYVSVNWSTMKVPVIGNMVSSSASGTFYGYDWARLSQSHGQFGVSVYGACTVMTFRGDQGSTADPVAPDPLDAGNLTLTGPDSATRAFTSSTKGSYSIASLPYTTSPSGNFTVTGQGGANVGAFTSTLTLPQAFVWSNVDAITQVTRASGVTINWTGGAGMVSIMGMSIIESPQSAGAMFLCLEQASKGAFTVPPAVLLALPVSATSDGVPMGSLMVSDQAAKSSFNPNPPSGLDIGSFSATFATIKTLGYN